MRRWWAPCALALFLAGSARAEPSADDVAGARAAMERGLKELAAGDADAALADFKHAQDLVPDANVPHRYAADALEKLARWSDAAAELETYLKIRPWVKDADEVRARIAKIRAEHLTGRLDVVCEPQGAEVRLDDAPDAVGTCPTRGLVVAAGEHRVHLRAHGFKDFELPATVPAGGVASVHGRLEAELLQPVRVRVLLEDPPPAPEAPKRGITSKWWFWAGVGVVAVAAGTTAAVFATKRQGPPSSDGGSHPFP